MTQSTPKEKWRAMLWQEHQLERFDKLVASFEAASPEDQRRTWWIAVSMAQCGPMSPTHAAYLNYVMDTLKPG